MLLIGVILLGGFILIFERGNENTHQKEQRKRTVFEMYPESIERILMERNGAKIECEKSSGVWKMIQPLEAPVDSGVVDKMIYELTRIVRGELITAETLKNRNLTPADYGFDAPRARVTVRNNRGTATWLIGRDAPLGKTLYVMPEGGSDIIAAPGTLLHLIPENPDWIRDRTLFFGEVTAVRGLDLRRPGGFLRLRQTGDSWMMEQPHGSRADQQAVAGFIEKLLSASIVSFISEEKTDLIAYGLEEPVYEMTLFSQDEKTQTLQIGRPLEEHPGVCFAKRIETDSVFSVPEEWVKLLDADANSFRNRQVVNLFPDQITQIEMAYGERQIELSCTSNRWQVIRPVRWDADPARMEELLKTLAEASIVEFLNAPASGPKLDDPSNWKVTLSTGEQTNILHISKEITNGLRQVQVGETPSFGTTAATIVRDSFTDPLFYRSPVVLKIDPALVKSITLKRDGEAAQTAKKTDTGSFVAEETARQVNPEILVGVLSELDLLRTARYVELNPETLQPYGLEQPSASLTIALSSTNAIGRVILIGNESDDGRFAMIQGMDFVFVLSKETAQTLTGDLTVPIENQAEKIKEP